MARLLSGLLLTSAADSWRALARCFGERFGSVVGQRMSAPCPLRDRPCRGVRPQRGGIWQRSRDVRLLCCVRLEPLAFSGNVRGRLRKLSEVGFGSSQPKKALLPAANPQPSRRTIEAPATKLKIQNAEMVREL